MECSAYSQEILCEYNLIQRLENEYQEGYANNLLTRFNLQLYNADTSQYTTCFLLIKYFVKSQESNLSDFTMIRLCAILARLCLNFTEAEYSNLSSLSILTEYEKSNTNDDIWKEFEATFNKGIQQNIAGFAFALIAKNIEYKKLEFGKEFEFLNTFLERLGINLTKLKQNVIANLTIENQKYKQELNQYNLKNIDKISDFSLMNLNFLNWNEVYIDMNKIYTPTIILDDGTYYSTEKTHSNMPISEILMDETSLPYMTLSNFIEACI